MFKCTELFEETGRFPGRILGCRDISGLAREISSVGYFFTHLTAL